MLAFVAAGRADDQNTPIGMIELDGRHQRGQILHRMRG